jgi:hypothetical protein
VNGEPRAMTVNAETRGMQQRAGGSFGRGLVGTGSAQRREDALLEQRLGDEEL